MFPLHDSLSTKGPRMHLKAKNLLPIFTGDKVLRVQGLYFMVLNASLLKMHQ